MQDEGSLDSSNLKTSKLSKTSLRLDAFVCYVFAVKGIKLTSSLVF